ncbi:Endonuclease/exonuclease/phosphatase - like 5 [Theobroma cacao]|nr:Endonuclease/exonuclease/phosphatase - like 5 [Theobroma cacao]
MESQKRGSERVSLEAARVQVGDANVQLSQLGNNEVVSLDGCLQLGTVHSFSNKFCADNASPGNVIGNSSKSSVFKGQGYCCFNKEPSFIPSQSVIHHVDKEGQMLENQFSGDVQDPWLVVGDFNVILSRDERLSGTDPHTGAMEDFATALFDCGLLDAGFEGNKFTWTNSHMFQRLDRVVYNSQWGSQFTTTRIHHLNRDGSDHCPLLISCSNSNVQRPSSFRFLHSEKQVDESEKRFQEDQSPTNRESMNLSYARLNHLLSVEEAYWQQ